MKTALIIIDIQNDYFEGGKHELFHPVEAAQNTEKVLKVFREKKLPVFHIQHIMDFEGAPFFQKGTKGAEIFDLVKPINSPYETLVVKHKPNSFLNTILKGELDKVDINDVVICGMMTHMCVDTTVRACADYGINVTLISDTCTTRNLEFNGNVIPAQIVNDTYMASLAQGFANVVTTESFLNSFNN